MDDFNTDDIFDEILNSPPTKRKETKDSKSLESTPELRRSTKSVTFVDQCETKEWDSKGENKEAPAAPSGKVVSGKTESRKFTKERMDDFDEENIPLSGLDTPRSEESSIAFPDDSPRKTTGSASHGGGGGGSVPVNAPKMGFDLFTTSSTVSEELEQKVKKNDFNSFLGSLNAKASAKDESDDQLNSSGSAYQPWAASKSRRATGDATLDINSVLQNVDLTLKKRPVTAPAVDKSATVDPAEKPAKKILSRLLVDDDDDMFGTTPLRTRRKSQQQQPLAATIEGRTSGQPPPSTPPLAATTAATFELEQPAMAAAALAEPAPLQPQLLQQQPQPLAGDDGDADAIFTVKRPPTGRRARGGENLGGLFDSDGRSESAFLLESPPRNRWGGGQQAQQTAAAALQCPDTAPTSLAAANQQSRQLLQEQAGSGQFFSMPSISLSNEMKLELETEIKKLRREKEDLQQLNEQLQQKAKAEQARVEDSHKRTLADSEELFRRREEMLLKENDQLKQKHGDTLRQMDLERAKMRSEFNRQLDELAQEKRRDLDQLREQHRNDVEALRSAAPHAGALSNLVDRLSHLSEKLGTLSDRESSYRLKDEVYRQTEVTDRQVMHEVVQSLKVRVDESARSERWLQDLATQLMEERRALAAERAELRVLKLTEGARQSDSETERLALAEERTRLQELDAKLRHGRSELLRQRSDMETRGEELKLKEGKLIDGQRSLEERLEIVSRREKMLREQQAKMDAAAVEHVEKAKRVDGIQAQLAELRLKEREVSQAMIHLAEERASLDSRAGGLLCASCRAPVRESHATLAVGGGLRVASSGDFAFARSRSWDDLEEEKLYLESLSHAPYG